MPAGHVEAGETVTQASIREAAEEVGLALRADQLEVVHVMHRAGDVGPDGVRARDDERIDFFLLVREWEGEPVNAEPQRCDDLLWCPMDELPANMVPYVRAGLGCVQRGLAFSEFGWD